MVNNTYTLTKIKHNKNKNKNKNDANKQIFKGTPNFNFNKFYHT